ncbi:hypothetical protein K8I61_00825 [bacterium]|nr:hypothetical protein [bacterium]
MSHFACINDHPNRAGASSCEVCGRPVAYMDGLSGSEWAMREAIEDERADQDEDTNERETGDDE